MNRTVTRIALGILAVPAVAMSLSACSGSSPRPVATPTVTQRPVSESTSSQTTAAPTVSHVAPPPGSVTHSASPTPLSTPAEVTNAYARMSLGDQSLWLQGTPTKAVVLARLTPYVTGKAYHLLAVGKPEDIWHSEAFAVPSLGRPTGTNATTTTPASCTQSGASAECTATAAITVHRAGASELNIVRTIDVRLVPAPTRGGAAWLINNIDNHDQVS